MNPTSIAVRILSVAAISLVASAGAVAQSGSSGSPSVTGRGPFWRSWQATTAATNATTGAATQKVSAWTELGDGLCYLENGQYVDSQDLIELAGNNAVATHGPTKVIFSPSTTAPGGLIDLQTVSGNRLHIAVQSLHYFDAASGTNIIIATVKDSTGVLYPPNTVVYPDAFDLVKADVRFTYTKGAFEQDIVLSGEAALPAPEAFGLPSATTRLQVWTLFNTSIVPTTRQRVLKQETDPLRRATMAAPDLLDDTIDFGYFWLPTGAAFRADGAAAVSTNEAAAVRLPSASDPGVLFVGKQWVPQPTGGLLIEQVDYTDLVAKLAAGPRTAALRHPIKASTKNASASATPVGARQASKTFLAANAAYRSSGIVLDWQGLGGSVSSYTFSSNTTYYITNSFSVSSTATFQANCCVKFNTNAYFLFYGNGLYWPSSSSTPAVFSSKDDDSFGDKLIGITTSVPYYAARNAIWIYYPGTSLNVNNARIRWAQQGIEFDDNSGAKDDDTVSGSEFENSNTAIYLNMPSGSVSLSSASLCHSLTGFGG